MARKWKSPRSKLSEADQKFCDLWLDNQDNADPKGDAEDTKPAGNGEQEFDGKPLIAGGKNQRLQLRLPVPHPTRQSLIAFLRLSPFPPGKPLLQTDLLFIAPGHPEPVPGCANHPAHPATAEANHHRVHEAESLPP